MPDAVSITPPTTPQEPPETPEGTVKHNGNNDYRLTGASAWVEVGTVVAYVRNTGTGLLIEVYPNTHELGDLIEKLYVPFPTVTEEVA